MLVTVSADLTGPWGQRGIRRPGLAGRGHRATVTAPTSGWMAVPARAAFLVRGEAAPMGPRNTRAYRRCHEKPPRERGTDPQWGDGRQDSAGHRRHRRHRQGDRPADA